MKGSVLFCLPDGLAKPDTSSLHVNPDSLTSLRTSPVKVFDIINRLPVKKAGGVDGITPVFFELAHQVSRRASPACSTGVSVRVFSPVLGRRPLSFPFLNVVTSRIHPTTVQSIQLPSNLSSKFCQQSSRAHCV